MQGVSSSGQRTLQVSLTSNLRQPETQNKGGALSVMRSDRCEPQVTDAGARPDPTLVHMADNGMQVLPYGGLPATVPSFSSTWRLWPCSHVRIQRLHRAVSPSPKPHPHDPPSAIGWKTGPTPSRDCPKQRPEKPETYNIILPVLPEIPTCW